MVISGLSLNNFRSYSESAFEFDESVNIIVGPNASGKTNLLEAVLLSCTGKSYRAKDIDLIKQDKPWTRIEAVTSEGKRVLTISRPESDSVASDQRAVGNSQKRFKINSVDYKRLSVQKSIPVVLFEPDHLRLLSGGPERRRDYLDGLLEQTTSGYSKLRRDYKRTLAQRNALLKDGGSSIANTIFAWNIRLSELGGKIANYRNSLVERIGQSLEDIYREISETDSTLDISYLVDVPLEDYSSKMNKKLEHNLQSDKEKGFTSIGPHRHDFVVSLNGQTASVAASRGEVRSILLALKMIELELLKSSLNKSPVLLLDDVFSELDGSRRKALTKRIASYQTFITTTDADIVVGNFLDKCKVIPLNKQQ